MVKGAIKIATCPAPGFTSSHRCTKCTVPHEAIPSERNIETSSVTPAHQETQKIPTSKLVGKAESPSPQTLPLAQCHTVGRKPSMPSSSLRNAGLDHISSAPSFGATAGGVNPPNNLVMKGNRACVQESYKTTTDQEIVLNGE